MAATRPMGLRHVWRRTPVPVKMLVAPAIAGVAAVLLFALFVESLDRSIRTLESQRSLYRVDLGFAFEMQHRALGLRNLVYQSLALSVASYPADVVEDVHERFDVGVEKFEKQLDTAAARMITGGHESTLTDVRALFERFEQAALTARAMMNTRSSLPLAAMSISTLDGVYNRLESVLDDFAVRQESLIDEAHEQILADARRARYFAIVVVITCMALAVIVKWRVIRSITIPLARAVSLAGGMAEGKLVPVDVSASGDETERMLASMNAMSTRLAGTIGDIGRVASRLDDTASGIQDSNHRLDERVRNHVRALEHTVEVANKLMLAVFDNATSARRGTDMVEKTVELAAQGRCSMVDMVERMKAVDGLSAQIGDITATIDSLALQTDILAINASVEAARAGEHGRGFGVVANEIRSLATHSADSAGSIRALLTDSIRQLDETSTCSRDVEEQMRRIEVSVASVRELIGAIVAVSDTQASAIEEVVAALGQMENAIGHNVSAMAQATKAAEVLRGQSRELTTSLGWFSTGDRDGATVDTSDVG